MADKTKLGIITAVIAAILVVASTALAYSFSAYGKACGADTKAEKNETGISYIKEDVSDIKAEQRSMHDKIDKILLEVKR